jgi:hypothetical protein
MNRRIIIHTHYSLHILFIPLQTEGILSESPQALLAFCECIFLATHPDPYCNKRDRVIPGNHVSSVLYFPVFSHSEMC